MVAGRLSAAAQGAGSPRGQSLVTTPKRTSPEFHLLLAQLAEEHDREVRALKVELSKLDNSTDERVKPLIKAKDNLQDKGSPTPQQAAEMVMSKAPSGKSARSSFSSTSEEEEANGKVPRRKLPKPLPIEASLLQENLHAPEPPASLPQSIAPPSDPPTARLQQWHSSATLHTISSATGTESDVSLRSLINKRKSDRSPVVKFTDANQDGFNEEATTDQDEQEQPKPEPVLALTPMPIGHRPPMVALGASLPQHPQAIEEEVGALNSEPCAGKTSSDDTAKPATPKSPLVRSLRKRSTVSWATDADIDKLVEPEAANNEAEDVNKNEGDDEQEEPVARKRPLRLGSALDRELSPTPQEQMKLAHLQQTLQRSRSCIEADTHAADRVLAARQATRMRRKSGPSGPGMGFQGMGFPFQRNNHVTKIPSGSPKKPAARDSPTLSSSQGDSKPDDEDNGLPLNLRREGRGIGRAKSFVSSAEDEGSMTHHLAMKFAWVPGNHTRKLSVRSSGRLTMANLASPLASIDRLPEDKYNGPLRLFIAVPTSPKRVTWEVLAALCIFYDIIMVPLLLVFDPPETVFLSIMDWFTLSFWTINIPLSFFVGVIHDGVLIMTPKRIAVHYIRKWLAIDLLAVAPDWTARLAVRNQGSGFAKSFRVLRISRTLRLLRLLRLRWILEVINDIFHTEATDIVANILKMSLILLLLCHYAACMWFAVGESNEGEWVTFYSLEDLRWGDQWLVAFHWAVAQFTQSGMYVQPVTRVERAYVVCIIMVALFAFSYTVGAITSYLGQLRSLKEDGSKQLWVARRFLREHGVAPHLNIRIIRYLEKEYERQRSSLSLEGIPIFSYLSEQLRNELLCAVCKPTLEKHPLLAKVMDLSEMVIQRLAARCVSQQVMAGGDMLFVPYDTPKTMGSVMRGQITYAKVDLRGRHHTFHLAKSEGWVTEHVLWTDEWVCLGEARAETDCELQLVSAELFSEILSPIPSLVNLAGKYAAAFMHWVNKSRGEDLLDIIFIEDTCTMADKVIDDFDAEFEPSEPLNSTSTRPHYLTRALSFFSRGLLSAAG